MYSQQFIQQFNKAIANFIIIFCNGALLISYLLTPTTITPKVVFGFTNKMLPQDPLRVLSLSFQSFLGPTGIPHRSIHFTYHLS